LSKEHRKNIVREVHRILESMEPFPEIRVQRVEYRREYSRWILRIIIDKEGGVTLSDCEKFSRHFSDRLDEEDIIEEKYYLEVASPGVKKGSEKKEAS